MLGASAVTLAAGKGAGTVGSVVREAEGGEEGT